MLRIFSTCLRGVLLTLGIAVAQSCSHQAQELPAPLAAPAATGVSVAEAQNWYQTAHRGQLTGPNNPNNTTSNLTAGATSATTTAQLVWQRALTVGTGAQQLVLVPFAGDAALFTHSPFTGPRYLLVSKQSTNALDGKIIELILPRTSQPVDTLALFTSLYRSYQSGHLAAPSQVNGFVFLYSADYRYLTGRQFQKGQFLPGTAWLAFQPVAGSIASAKTTQRSGHLGGAISNSVPVNTGCTDWYDGNTGRYITTTGDCRQGDPPPLIYTGGGGRTPAPGDGPGGHGGSGGSSGSNTPTITSTTVLVVPPDIPVTDIRQFLKCFDANQAATLTVYDKQPVPGTADTHKGTEVGHAFISLSQNGVTRVFGFYPTSPSAVLYPVASVFGDDSKHGYDVSITTTIPPASLSNLLNYAYGYTGNQYSLQHNNCVNFDIGACAQIGLTLPNTPGVWVGVFGGSNPGDLGQDMRAMTLPFGVTRNSVGGTAPSNAGGC